MPEPVADSPGPDAIDAVRRNSLDPFDWVSRKVSRCPNGDRRERERRVESAPYPVNVRGNMRCGPFRSDRACRLSTCGFSGAVVIRQRLAPAADLAMLVAFVVIGRGAHDLHAGAGWFLSVLWPLGVGWFAAALGFRVYGSGPDSWARTVFAWGFGMTIGLLLRATVTGRPTPLPFVIVLLMFTAVTLFGWRVCAVFLERIVEVNRAA